MVVTMMMFGTSNASEDKFDNQQAAELLLQSLGKQNKERNLNC